MHNDFEFNMRYMRSSLKMIKIYTDKHITVLKLYNTFVEEIKQKDAFLSLNTHLFYRNAAYGMLNIRFYFSSSALTFLTCGYVF